MLYTDGGGKGLAVLNPIIGAENLSLLYGDRPRAADSLASYDPTFLNGLPAVFIRAEASVRRWRSSIPRAITAIYVRNPDKLRHVALPG